MNYERKIAKIQGQDITIFDLGGQTSFLDRFTGELAEFVFSGVKAFIYVVDGKKFEEVSRSKYYLDLCLRNLDKYSNSAKRYVFLHKCDLLKEEMITDITVSLREYMLTGYKGKIEFFNTSVFSDSIFQAFAQITKTISGPVTSVAPFVEEFIRENEGLIRRIQIFSKDGNAITELVPKGALRKFKAKEAREAMQILGNLVGEELPSTLNAVIYETNEVVIYCRLIDNGPIIFAEVSKDTMTQKKETVASILTRLGAFSHRVAAYSPSEKKELHN